MVAFLSSEGACSHRPPSLLLPILFYFLKIRARLLWTLHSQKYVFHLIKSLSLACAAGCSYLTGQLVVVDGGNCVLE